MGRGCEVPPSARARPSRPTTPSYFRYKLSKIVRELMTWLIQLDVIRAGHDHHDHATVLAFLDFFSELRAFRPQLIYRRIDFIAHERDGVLARMIVRFPFPDAVRRVHTHLARSRLE